MKNVFSRKVVNRMKVDLALAKGNLIVGKMLEDEEEASKILEELGRYYLELSKRCNMIDEE